LKGGRLKLSVAIEYGTTGVWYGRYIEYLGTHARAFDRPTLLDELEKELNFHLSWMDKHGITAPIVSNPEIVVVEEQTDINELGVSGGEVALFEFDKQLVTNNQLQAGIQYMTFNRRDLLELVKDLTTSELEFTPTGKGRNITQILSHICNAEEWYISRMGKKATQKYLEYAQLSESELDKLSIFDRLETVRAACIETLKSIIPHLEDMVFKRPEFTNYPNEKWTAYKVLRRFLEHEREHYYNIKEYLGIPPRAFNWKL
jgi:uncharacterized damage-inducible protein DinB